MSEAVTERVEVQAPAEEVFEFWADRANVCALVRMAEETRRVDLSESLWNFRGPAGRSVEFGPDQFRGCLRRERLGEEAGVWSSPDLVLGDVFVDFKTVSEHKTVLLFTYHTATSFARTSDDPPGEARGRYSKRGYLHLRAIVEEILTAHWQGITAPVADAPEGPSAAGDASVGPQGFLEGSPEHAMTDEDREWLETDLSRLDEYDPYELTDEQLAEEEPIRYVPGVGLVVDDGGEDDDPPPRGTEPGPAG